MAFSLDRTRCYVRIDEPNLISLYRSTSSLVPELDCCQGHSCEAFICAAREYNLFRVYVCLHNTQLKSNLVFVADPVSFDNKKNAALIKEAESFLAKIGFSMERVNLEFSAATREVILHDMKIMREPSLAVRLDAAMLAIDELTAEKNELIKKTSRAEKSYRAEVDKLRQQLTKANTGSSGAAEITLKDESTMAALISDRDSLRAQLEILRAETESLRGELSQANANQPDTSADSLVKSAKKEVDVLREELRIALKKADAAEYEVENARQEIQVLQDAVRDAQEAVSVAEQKVVKLLEDVRVSREATLNAEADVQSARQEITSLRDAAKAFKEKTQSEKSSTQADYSAEISSLQQEIARLHLEHDKAMAIQTNEIGTLRAALAIADENLSYERTKNDSALQEMDALERNASLELKKLKKKVDLLSDEKRVLESMATEMKTAAKEEIERLQQINQSQRRAAVKKVKSLTEEIRQLSEARAVMTSPISASLATVNTKNSGFESETPAQFTVSENQQAGFSDPFGLSGNAEYISFEPDPALDGIPYYSLEDIVEVHRSFNKIQASPLGKKVQNCDGFVCLVKGAEQDMAVYVVWLMKETGDVLVCRPDHIPESGNIALHMVREGIGYFERVGFIMDRLILVPDPEKRQQQIDSLPFFHKNTLECAA